MSNAGTVAVAAMAALVFGVIASGCGSSDERQIRAAINTWQEGAQAKDVDKIMSIVSDDFSHDGQEYRAESAADLRNFVAGSIEEGGFDGVEVILSDMKIDMAGAVATAYPIGWETPEGSITLELMFAKEADAWRLTDMAIGDRDERGGAPKNAADAMARFDDNGDGQLSTDEMPEALRERAIVIDANGDGNLNKEELEAAYQRMGRGASAERVSGRVTAEQVMTMMDTNSDGKITMEEAPGELQKWFAQLDQNADDGIDLTEAQPIADAMNDR